MTLTIHQLQVFAEVVEQGSFKQAAEGLHLTQPTITFQVRQLENEVGSRCLSARDARSRLLRPASSHTGPRVT